uniref:transcription factor bHLH18-like n=1 Tax=Erigeron canadensis TaxID=72917 RepID=UPI001CB9AA26|nr:transcription factor bHLH18-like [Erigeron canadensis]
MEDPCFNTQWPFNSFDDHQLTTFGDNINTHHFYDNALPMFDHHYKPIMEPSPRPSKQLKTSSWNSCISSDQSIMNPTPHYNGNDSYVANQANVVSPKEEGVVSSKSTIGFTYDTSPSSNVQFHNQSYNHHVGSAKKVATTTNTAKFNTPQDHILAERKRREKLSQRFIALSALIPGLKKMDKASVLGDAIKHLKHLQDKVKTLEEQAKRRSNIESVVFVKRHEVSANGDEVPSSDEKLPGGPEQLPEMEARFSGKDVLIRVHCEKKKGAVEEILAEIEKLNLSVINTTALTFANYALDITIICQMDQDFTMTTKDLVKNLRISFKRFM